MFSNIDFTRRNFLKTTAAMSAAAVLTQASGLYAAGSQTIRVALVGCGGRGKGALNDFLQAAKTLNLEVKIAGFADAFKAVAVDTAKQHQMPEDICYGGYDSYKKIMASDADVVILATPPAFRPVHYQAAVEAGKHAFIEKPVAVDAPGARKIIEAGQLAAQKGLSVVAGTQRRHQADYLRTQYVVSKGAIGKITSGTVWWCQGALWIKPRNPGESDADYMARNWVNFTEMSGDHIVEQHVHNLDIANWFIGSPPKSAVGFGSRARRKTGNQYDFFSVDYEYDNDCIIHSMCRQVNGCYDRVNEYFIGTEATTFGSGPVKSSKPVNFEIPEFKTADSPYVQEHIDLLKSILDGKPLNESKSVAESTLTGIMGRISAYTGQMIRWTDLTDPKTQSPWYSYLCSPSAADFENGVVKAPQDDVAPVAGQEEKPQMPDKPAAV